MQSWQMRPPRAMHPIGHQLGRVLGTAGDVEKQKKTLYAALQQLEKLNVPGTIIDVNV